jgi:hypothetical protein
MPSTAYSVVLYSSLSHNCRPTPLRIAGFLYVHEFSATVRSGQSIVPEIGWARFDEIRVFGPMTLG